MDRRAFGRLGRDFDLSADELDTLDHAEQADAGTADGADASGTHVKSNAVVRHDQFQFRITLTEFHANILGPRVTCDVGQTFLSDTEASGGNLG